MKGLHEPLKVDTDEERADIFTKAMPKGTDDYYKFRDDLMNVNPIMMAKMKS